MAAEDIIRRWERLLKLISMKATGTPDELSRKLGVSKPTVLKDVQILNDMSHKGKVDLSRIGKGIVFDHGKRSYRFMEE